MEPSWNDGEAVRGGQRGQKLGRGREIKPSGRGAGRSAKSEGHRAIDTERCGGGGRRKKHKQQTLEWERDTERMRTPGQILGISQQFSELIV